MCTVRTDRMASSTKDTPSDALMQLWSPDGYYTYLDVKRGAEIDEDAIKKNYRKLSLKHHPDRSGGDAETFRVLNRAQKVLTNAKLRQQYDILGLDLDDDEEHSGSSGDDSKDGEGEESSASQGIVNEMAQMALTAVLQTGVRTTMLAVVSLLVTRYIWTLVPGLMFLAFIAYKIHSVASGTLEMTSPFIIGAGLVLMYQTRDGPGWFLFWVGEALVTAIFTLNSLGIPKTTPVVVAVGIFSSVAALWFRGKFWNYAIIIGLEFFLAVFIALAFPIMEMVFGGNIERQTQKSWR